MHSFHKHTKLRKIIFSLFAILSTYVSEAQLSDSLSQLNSSSLKSLNNHLLFEYKPGLTKHLSKIPVDISQLALSPFQKNNWIAVSGITAATIVMVKNDQQITNWVIKASDKAGLSPNTSYKDIVKFGKTRILKVPQNVNTALYQIGEGGTTMMLASGLWIAGKLQNNPRDIQTAYDLTETFVGSGIVSQVIKRVSGRESPFKATVPGGRWRPFPSFSTYQNNTSSYDAFPSGHLTTLTATFTVLHYNYPEKKWIAPLGAALLAMSSWAMINTEVHWISDYPLALACGYITGKAAAMRHRKKAAPMSINPLNQ